MGEPASSVFHHGKENDKPGVSVLDGGTEERILSISFLLMTSYRSYVLQFLSR